MRKEGRNPQEESLGYWVFRINRAMHAAFTRRLSALGVTGAEWAVLAQAAQGGLTPIALARQMGIDRAAVTRFIDQLEEKGLVRRTSHPTDGRSTVLALTAAGKALLPKLVAASKETNREFLKLLPPGDGAALFGLLRDLGERLPEGVFPSEACAD